MTEPATAEGLQAHGIAKIFTSADGSPLRLLDGCSLHAEPGKLTVLIGPSGCGKSTLAYILAGYLEPDEGRVTLDGQDVSGSGPDRLMVFQETALWPWMTVRRNVMFGPTVRGDLSRDQARRRADELLEKFGLSAFKDKYPHQLSGGMKRRAEIAQALINNPRTMILDEPFRGLDVMTRELMQEYYLSVFEETRVTTLFITSEIEEAIFLADRILIMAPEGGAIVETIEVDLPRPRTFDMMASERYQEIKAAAIETLYRNELDDIALEFAGG
ncbi:MAG: ABC transporter ATP-binding protein [Methyloligellaceae bacterium]